MLKTKIENIPEFLKKNAKWAVSVNGIPHSPITDKPMYLGEEMTFDEVIKNVKDYEYLAFKVEEPLNMGFIDLDAHNEEEEKLLKTLLSSFKRLFDSYMEVSKSGKGYHILVFTDIKELYRVNANKINNEKRCPIEYYTRGKWCTITGDIVDDRKEIKNNDEYLNQMLSRFFSIREETNYDGCGVEEGEKIRSNEDVIRLVNNDKFLSNLWNHKLGGIVTRKGESVSYNNHTADFLLIRGIMFYCNANIEQAKEVYKLSPQYKHYEKEHFKGYKREADVNNAIKEALKSLKSVFTPTDDGVVKSVEERAIELEEKLMSLTKEEEELMTQVDSLFDITEEEKVGEVVNSVDISKVEGYVNLVNSVELKDALSTYIAKRKKNNDLIVNFIENSEVYTTSIEDLAKLTNFVTNDEIFYSKAKESFVMYNGKYWEEKDNSMLLAEVHKALNILYDNAFKHFIGLIDIFKERKYADEAYKAQEEDARDSKKYDDLMKGYSNKIKASEKFILSKFTKVLKILESNKTPLDVINYLASTTALDFVPYEETDLLNFQNGTLNIKTGEFKEFDKNDRLTCIMGCDYEPNAECPNFDKFLKSMFETEETGTQFKRTVASCLVKDSTPKHKKYFFLLQGPTGTGKTTIINTILSMMGTYGKSSKYQTFMKTNREYSGATHNQDIVELIGKQFITCSEPSDTAVFAADFLKAFTGGSNLSVRAAYGHKFINFKNTGLLFIDSNFAPKIATFDQATMDRFQVFPMLKQPKEKDNELGNKLEKELSGIFNKIYSELIKLEDEPFTPSKEMEDYKAQYREESSDILQWFNETLEETELKEELTFLRLYLSYEGWCKVNNKTPLTKAFFSKRVKDEAGIEGYKKSGQIVVAGFKFTPVGEVYSNYNTFEKRNEFYQSLQKVTASQAFQKNKETKEMSYTSLRQTILSKTSYWFATNIDLESDIPTALNKYFKYCQDCILDMQVPLLQPDYNAVIGFMFNKMKLTNGMRKAMKTKDFNCLATLSDEVRRISISANQN